MCTFSFYVLAAVLLTSQITENDCLCIVSDLFKVNGEDKSTDSRSHQREYGILYPTLYVACVSDGCWLGPLIRPKMTKCIGKSAFYSLEREYALHESQIPSLPSSYPLSELQEADLTRCNKRA